MNEEHTTEESRLQALLELASDDAERHRLTRLWRELAEVPGYADSEAEESAQLSVGMRPETESRRRDWRHGWLRAAALFALGAVTGALGSGLRPQAISPGAVLERPESASRSALAARRSAAERLEAVHALATLKNEPWAEKTLIDRALADSTPAVQLAALEALELRELSESAFDRLADGLGELDAPIVQIRLVDLLNRRSPSHLERALEQWTLDSASHPLARQHAERTVSLNQKRSTT